MASFDVDYDAASWAMVPFEFPTPAGEGEREWAERMAQDQRERGLTETRRTGTLEEYFLGLAAAARSATSDVAHDAIWALIHPEAPGMVLVALDLQDADEPFEDYVGAVAARRDDQYEPAVVTPLALGRLGDGVRILRHDIDADRTLYVSLYYLFRVQGLDLLLSAQSVDAPAITWAIPLVEELLSGVRVSVG